MIGTSRDYPLIVIHRLPNSSGFTLRSDEDELKSHLLISHLSEATPPLGDRIVSQKAICAASTTLKTAWRWLNEPSVADENRPLQLVDRIYLQCMERNGRLRGPARSAEYATEQLWPCFLLPKRCGLLKHIRGSAATREISEYGFTNRPDTTRKVTDHDLSNSHGKSDVLCGSNATPFSRTATAEWRPSPDDEWV